MTAQVAIIHGWSDTSKSFGDLSGFLARNGFDVRQIWLGDYVSMDDDVRIEDVAKRMQAVVGEAIRSGSLKPPFDLIVHSTGGLVAREWIATCYPDGKGCPVRRLVMLAPANFGSRLAALGKSMIGRVAKGWNNWFQTGEEMLRALELASPYQWRLARRDLFDVAGDGRPGPYGPTRVMPFVITGTRAYSGGLRTIVNEHGSDGTVRACAANLNAAGMTIDFSEKPETPRVTVWPQRHEGHFPFAVVPDRDHGAVTRPDTPSGAAPDVSALCGRLILQALNCSPDGYGEVAEEWSEITEATTRLGRPLKAGEADPLAEMFGRDLPDRQAFHPHMQAAVRVIDDHGRPVKDYFLEFFSPNEKGTRDSEIFHREVLTHVHTNTQDPSLRAFYIDHSDLLRLYYGSIAEPKNRQLAVSLSAAKIGQNIRYFDSTKDGAAGHHVLHREASDSAAQPHRKLFRNRTHLLEVIIPRQPVAKVFRLSQ